MLNMFNYTAELSSLQHTQLFLIIKTDILKIYVQPITLLVNTAFLPGFQNKFKQKSRLIICDRIFLLLKSLCIF